MSCWLVPNPSQQSLLTSDISLACANVYGTPGSHLLHRIEASSWLISVLSREKSDKPEIKKPRKLVSFQGFRYCESGGEEEIRTQTIVLLYSRVMFNRRTNSTYNLYVQ